MNSKYYLAVSQILVDGTNPCALYPYDQDIFAVRAIYFQNIGNDMANEQIKEEFVAVLNAHGGIVNDPDYGKLKTYWTRPEQPQPSV